MSQVACIFRRVMVQALDVRLSLRASSRLNVLSESRLQDCWLTGYFERVKVKALKKEKKGKRKRNGNRNGNSQMQAMPPCTHLLLFPA